MKNWKLTLTILAASSVLMSSSYTMLIPFLPMYLIQELGVEQANVNWWSSIIFSVSFLISGLMAPVWGALADKKSRKLMAIRASLCLSISYILGGFVTTPWELFAMRVFQGFAAGLWPALLSIMSGEAPPKRLGFCMGVMQAGLTAGHVLGPLAGGVLAELFTMRATFIIAGAALFLISLAIIFLVHETPRVPSKNTSESGNSAEKPSVLSIPAVQRMLFAACIVQMTILMTQPVLPLYIAELQGSMDQIVLISGIVFSIIGISGVIASPIWGIVGQGWGFRPALYLALLLSGIFGVIQAIPQDLTAFTAWRFVGGLTFAGIFPAVNAVLTQSTDPADRGKVFGYSYAAQQLGSVIGPILGGAMATWISNQMVVAMAGAFLFPLVALLYFRRPREHGATGTPQHGV